MSVLFRPREGPLGPSWKGWTEVSEEKNTLGVTHHSTRVLKVRIYEYTYLRKEFLIWIQNGKTTGRPLRLFRIYFVPDLVPIVYLPKVGSTNTDRRTSRHASQDSDVGSNRRFLRH